jgi:transketolase
MYVRLSRAKTPIVYDDSYKFEIGKGNVLREGTDLAIVACGVQVPAALEAAKILEAEGIQARVINMATIKPLDGALMEQAAKECGALLTSEEHQVAGGLGSAIAEHLAQTCPVPMELTGVNDIFGESGTSEQLLAKHELDGESLAASARKLLKRKA